MWKYIFNISALIKFDQCSGPICLVKKCPFCMGDSLGCPATTIQKGHFFIQVKSLDLHFPDVTSMWQYQIWPPRPPCNPGLQEQVLRPSVRTYRSSTMTIQSRRSTEKASLLFKSVVGIKLASPNAPPLRKLRYVACLRAVLKLAYAYCISAGARVEFFFARKRLTN